MRRSVLLLFLLVCVLFGPVLFGARVLYERDLMSIWYPQAKSLVRCVSMGSWPLWDPWVGFGQPLFALPDAQVAYPFGWLRLVLDAPDYYAIFVAAHLVFSGTGLALFLRKLGLSQAPAFVGAALWVLSGPLVSMVNLWHHFASAAWAPWVLLALAAFLERSDARRSALLAAAIAFQLLAGSADMAVLTFGVAALFLVARLRARPGLAPGRRVVAPLAGTWLLGAAMAALLWVPAAFLAKDSARSSLPEEWRVQWAMHPAHLLEIASPVPLQDLPLRRPSRVSLFGVPQRPFLRTVYLGLGGLVFVLAALARGPLITPRWPWLAAGAGAMLWAVGPHLPLYGALLRVLPPLAMLRYPSKAMIAVALSWSILAAIGAEAMRQPAPEPRAGAWRRCRILCGALACGLALLGAALYLAPPAPAVAGGPKLATLGVKLTSSALLGLVTLALLPARGAVVPGRLLAAVAVAVVELLGASRGINRDAPPSLLAFRPVVADRLQAFDGSRAYVYDYLFSPGDKSRRYLHREFPYLAAGTDDPFLHEMAAYEYAAPPLLGRFGIEGSYDMDVRGLQPRLLADLNDVLRAVEGTPLHRRLLQVGAVSRVSALHEDGLRDLEPVASLETLLPDPIRVFRVPGPRPRTYAVGRARFANGPDEIRALLTPSFDPATEVVVSGRGEPEPAAPFDGRSAILSFEPDRVALAAELSRPGWVVLVDAYDPGWRATVDGESATVRRANAAFRAVSVAAGRHRIEMVYRPGPVKWGLLVSAAASVVASLLAFGPLPGAIRAPGRAGAP